MTAIETGTPLDWQYVAATRTLLVSGEVDELSGVALRQCLAELSADYTQPLTVELSEVDFFPSLAVGVVVTALRNAERNGTRIALVAREGSISQRVLSICGIPHRWTLPDDPS